MNPTCDVVVMGGGPAGATAAALLAEHGRSVLVIEKEQFPRFHIGESLMPQTWGAFKRLGMVEKLEAANFVRKESVQFVAADGRESQPFYFHDRDPNPWSVTWQVRRAEFDRMMLDNAVERGADVQFGRRVAEVLFEGERARGVRVERDGDSRDIAAKVVVDATGQTALLSRQLGIQQAEPCLRKAAVYAHYRGAHRDSGRDEGATIIIHTPERRGWFWYIPLEDDTVSIGVVSDPKHLFRRRGDDPAAILDAEIADCPGVRGRLEAAERCSPVHVCSDFSYKADRIAGDGWVLVGDAFGFLDPIYSSGVMLALKSGELAADAVHDALNSGDLSGESLGRFGAPFIEGMARMRKLVYAFYDPKVSFGRFLKEHPHLQDQLTRLLIGDLFTTEVDEILERLVEEMEWPAEHRSQPSQVSR